MTLEAYLLIRHIMATALLAVGLTLALGVIPPRLRNTIFDSSRRIMGVAIAVLPIATITSYSMDLIYWGRDWSNLLYLTSCHIISILVSISYISLLGDKINILSFRFIRSICFCIIFPIPLALCIIFGDAPLIRIMSTVTAVVLAVTIIHECIVFYILYKNAVKRVNNYYSDDIEVRIQWIRSSAFFILSIAMLSSFVIFFETISLWTGLVISIYRCFVFVYVFYSFINFIINFDKMCKSKNSDENPILELEYELGLDDDEFELEPLGSEIFIAICERLDGWIEEQNYTQKGITIRSVSHDIATNRTYLSTYINANYHCSFKIWITRMRIDKSKHILKVSPDLSITEVASTVGFASTASFSRAFKQIVGTSPIKWRQKNVITELSDDEDVV